ncbi:hypothetical protein PUN28_013400 [Cardiocondyla obscurior]|uniref:Uncharacterized protein n=1 Tax=Cardiocondyla obscurior TaxID=286306 RepID=A0AAW2F9F8_9HYME
MRAGRSVLASNPPSQSSLSSHRRAVVRRTRGKRTVQTSFFFFFFFFSTEGKEREGKTERRRWRCHRRRPGCAASQRIPRSSSHHNDFIPPTVSLRVGRRSEVCEISLTVCEIPPLMVLLSPSRASRKFITILPRRIYLPTPTANRKSRN